MKSAVQVRFPGFFDLQVNGFAGVDFNTPSNPPASCLAAVQAIQATGVTRFLPTLITSSFESFARCAAALLRLDSRAIAGIHMEGPYISALDGPRGAHPRNWVVEASVDDFLRRQEAARGRIALVTLAPEIPGAMQLIEFLAQSGIRVAIGHTAASPQEIRDAVCAGAVLSTHLGNGCAQLLPRNFNFIWEQLGSDELFASFIIDGHHLPPATVKSMIRAKTPDRSILVTDAVAAAGAPPGRYRLGDSWGELDVDGRVSQPGTLNLAGSSLSMPKAVGYTVRFTGLSLEQVLPMGTSHPARLMGLEPSGEVSADWDPEHCRLSILAVDDVAIPQ